MSLDEGEITRLLHEADAGQEGALDKVMELVYQDLSGMAASHLRRRYGADLAGVTLEPAALVHETFLRLIRQRSGFDNRGHFFAIATRMMLRVLNDNARRKGAGKRGGDLARVTLSGLADQSSDHDITDFTRALERLDADDKRTGEVAKLRLLWGMTVPEIAETLSISEATVNRDWRFARRRLLTELA